MAVRLFVRLLFFCIGLASGGTSPEGKKWLEENKKKDGVKVTASGLQYRVVKSGPDGAPSPKANQKCECHYRGKTIDGKEFDSSYKRGKPTTFAPNQVIKGWTEAMQLMKEGDSWELTIPSELAYGDSGAGKKIPGGAVLIFELELLKVLEPSGFEIMGFHPEPMHIFALVGVAVLVGMAFLRSGSSTPTIKLEDASDEADPLVYFDMKIGSEPAGRIEIQLFHKICPKTVENFRCLCTGEKGQGMCGKPLHYKGCSFHRVIPGFMCQGGDFQNGNGTGGESIYGPRFDDEFDKGAIGHSKPMLLSMANAGPDTNGSQFFLTVAATPHLDGKHVVFGQVVKGEEVVKKVEKVGSGSGSTSQKVVIEDCGELKGKAT